MYLFDNDAALPVLTQPLLHMTSLTSPCKISVTFECEENANLPFLLQVDVAGDGSTTANIKMNTKWLSLAAIEYLLDNDATRVVLTQPLRRRMAL